MMSLLQWDDHWEEMVRSSVSSSHYHIRSDHPVLFLNSKIHLLIKNLKQEEKLNLEQQQSSPLWQNIFIFSSLAEHQTKSLSMDKCLCFSPHQRLWKCKVCQRLKTLSRLLFSASHWTGRVKLSDQPLKCDCFLQTCSRRGVQVYLCSLETAKRSTRAVKWMTVKPVRQQPWRRWERNPWSPAVLTES